ncbi:hypothetical protein FIBSPDRAFT_871261 [Athelia psychrophila]|uniref:Uncharacterized protein n=1 Tax=Athelia psychrophila TaxID=1759441 RepID=A0A166AFT3_9AGAM|nr:hypothetical protein FIBSPDRAFT_871261 [Fibularhizoctonia sp. CBS 109695]
MFATSFCTSGAYSDMGCALMIASLAAMSTWNFPLYRMASYVRLATMTLPRMIQE